MFLGRGRNLESRLGQQRVPRHSRAQAEPPNCLLPSRAGVEVVRFNHRDGVNRSTQCVIIEHESVENEIDMIQKLNEVTITENAKHKGYIYRGSEPEQR